MSDDALRAQLGITLDHNQRPHIRVRLATGIAEQTCRRMGLDYVDPASIEPADWHRRDDDYSNAGTMVENAASMKGHTSRL